MSVAGIHQRKDVWNHTNTEHPGQDICKTVWSPTIHKQDRKRTKLWGHNLQKMPEYILNNTCASHWPLTNRYSAYRNTLEYWNRECGEHEKHRCKVQTPTETSQRPGGCICRGITQAITNNMGKYTKKQMQTQTQTHTRTHTCTHAIPEGIAVWMLTLKCLEPWIIITLNLGYLMNIWKVEWGISKIIHTNNRWAKHSGILVDTCRLPLINWTFFFTFMSMFFVKKCEDYFF